MQQRKTQPQGTDAGQRDGTAAQRSWARHTEVFELVEQIRRNRARRQPQPSAVRRPRAS